MLLDSHCHLNSLSEINLRKVVDSFQGKGNKLIDSSIDLKSSQNSIELSNKYSFVYSSLGFHPFSCNNFSDQIYKKYKEFVEKNEKIVALGEIGLDYKADLPLKIQEEIFEKWLVFAKENALTVLIHNRLDKDNWYSDKYPNRPRILAILDNHFSDYKRIVFHCFSYAYSHLAQIIDKGGFASFSLNLLRKNKKIIDSLKKCPLDNLLLETDSPYMRIKGEPSSPEDIESVYSYVAELKDISKEELERIIFCNAKKVFKKI